MDGPNGVGTGDLTAEFQRGQYPEMRTVLTREHLHHKARLDHAVRLPQAQQFIILKLLAKEVLDITVRRFKNRWVAGKAVGCQ